MRRTLPIFILLAAASACGTATPPATSNTAATAPKNAAATPTVDPNAPLQFTSTSLVAAYDADPAAFKQKYLGRDLELSGTVDSIVFDEKDPNHVRGLRIVDDAKATPKKTVLCSFPEQKKVMKDDLKVAAGGPVKFKGSIIGNAAGLEIRITTLY